MRQRRFARRARGHRHIAIIAILAVVLGLTIGAPQPSYAADPGVARLLSLLGGAGSDPVKNLATWTEGLGGVGKLAEPLPLVQATPGGLLGFGANGSSEGLFRQVVTDALAGATQYADLNVDKSVTIDRGRTAHLKTTLSDEGAGKRLHIEATVEKQVGAESLHLASSSPKVDLTITDGVNVDVTAHLALDVVWTGATDDQLYVVSGANGPRLDVDAHASVDAATAKASVGILGVSISNPNLTVDAHLLGTVSDPDNDGKLGFGDALGQDGSLAGLFSIGLDPQGAAPYGSATTRGSVSGSVTLGAAASFGTTTLPAGLTLPSAISTTVGVDWPDIGTGSPTVTAPGLADTIGKFQNLSMGDLASGLAQIVVAINAIQTSKFNGTGDIDLPFMRGKLSDAVKVGQKLQDFIDHNSIKDPANGSVTAPTYSSIQELLDLLSKSAGIDVSGLDWDATTSKLVMKLGLTQNPPAQAEPLDQAAALASGPSAAYGASSLSVSGSPWVDAHGNPLDWKGRTVVAGTSVGTVKSNDANSLTLTGPWQGGQPSSTTPFVITGADAQEGAASFANNLTKGGDGKTGIQDANAPQTFAQVKPSYHASLTVVLDLQDPKTLGACNGFEGNTQNCPFNDTSGPMAVTVNALPLNTDRVMLRTGTDGSGNPNTGFTADLPITSKIDQTATAGFFKLHLTGNLSVCNSSLDAKCTPGTATGHMVSVGLKQQGDAQHDLRMSQLFKILGNPQPGSLQPQDLIDLQLGAHAYADVKVDVVTPDGTSFFAGATPEFTATWDSSDPTHPTFDTSGLTNIFNLDFNTTDPKALFAIVVKTLQTLADQVAKTNSSASGGILGKPIPGLGKSMRDLLASDESSNGEQVTYTDNSLTDGARSPSQAFPADLKDRTVVVGTQVGIVDHVEGGNTLVMKDNWTTKPTAGTPYTMRSALADAIDKLLAAPPDNIQDLVQMLNDALGTDAVKFAYLPGSGTDPASLALSIDWARKYHVGAPIKLALGSGTFAGVNSTAQASVGVDGHVKVGLLVPLADGAGAQGASDLQVLSDSSLGFKIHSELKGVVNGMIGPLSVALGKTGDEAVAQADFGVTLGGPSANPTPVSFSHFLSTDATLAFHSDGNADCGESLTTKLEVCGKLPLFVNGASAGTIALRIPADDDPTKLLDVSGNLPAPDDALPKLQVPDLSSITKVLDFTSFSGGIDAYLQRIEQALQLASFQGKLPLVGSDLQQGSDFVGKIRKTIDDAWAQLGTTPPKTTQDFTAFINGKLKTALGNNDIGASVKVSADCTASLQPPTLDSVTPTKNDLGGDADPGTQTYTYEVVAFQKDGSGYANDTLPSSAQSADNWKDFHKGSSNTVTWEQVDNATGYKVLRQLPGGQFKVVQTINDPATVTWNDTNAADTGTVYDFSQVTTNPKLDPCPSAYSDNVMVTLDLSRADSIDQSGCHSGSNTSDKSTQCLAAATRPLDIGIPGLSLKQGQAADGVKVALGYKLHLAIGLNKTDGLYIATHDAWDHGKAAPELQVGVDAELPALPANPGPDDHSLQAQLAFININVDKIGSDPEFAGMFQVDLRSSTGESHCFAGDQAGDPGVDCSADPNAKLTFADIGTMSLADMLPFRLTANANVNWHLSAETTSALPGVSTDFSLKWAFSNADQSGLGAPTIAFNNVGIDAGQFFSQILGPVIKQIKSVTGPIQPVVDTLYAPIPVLSDLSRMAGGGDVTLISLAQAYSTLSGGPDLRFVDTIKSINDFIKRIPTCTTKCFIPLGSFDLDGQKALDTPNSPSAASTMYSTADGAVNPAKGDAVKSAVNNASSDQSKTLFGSGGTGGDVDKSGFKFPILDNPMQAFNLLMGGDVDLVTFDSGPLSIGFSWRQDFGPVYAPPPVVITLAGSASATLHIRAGLDTYGLRKTVEDVNNGKPVSALTVLDGLYFATTDDQGNPLPVVTLTGEIAAGASVTVLIVSVGIEGGLKLTIGFYWNDPNNDGKYRISEIGQAVLNNPICLFRMSGELSLFLRLTITIGIGPFSTSFDIDLASIKLLDFSVTPNCTPPDPVLAEDGGDTLVVNAGRLGDGGTRGYSTWDKSNFDTDSVKVIALHYAQTAADPQGTDPGFDGVAVEALGFHKEWLNPNLKRVVVDGTNSNKPMVVSFTGDGKQSSDKATAGKSPTQFDLDAVVIGSDQKDTISTGTGNAYVDGRGGDDVIVTHELPGKVARIAGGGGNDHITTGNGDDLVAGDGTLGNATTTVAGKTVFDWNQAQAQDPTTSSDDTGTGNDVITVGLGRNKARGNAGDDTIGVASDQPQQPGTGVAAPLKAQPDILIGDAGSDHITGGSNNDQIFTAGENRFADGTTTPVTGVDANGPADDAGAVNVVDTGAGADTVWGSDQVDLVTSHSANGQTTRIYGGAGNDVLAGGYGTDHVYGGPDNDYVIAEPANVGNPTGTPGTFGPNRTVDLLPLPAGVTPSEKMLVGGLGNDHIIGGDGPSTIFGDKRIDAEKCGAGTPVASDPVGESTSASTGDGNDLILGGNGVDTVSAGGGDDTTYAGGGDDLVCGQQGNDTTYGGDGNDQVWGGTGHDLTYGNAGDDQLFGNAGDDTTYGGDGNDVIEGNDGADWLDGGAGNDTMYGGSRAAGRSDTDTNGPGGTAQGDDLYGDSGQDILIGDNGSATSPYPYDLDGSNPNAGAGDRIHGGDGNDRAYGGLGNDVISGDNGDDVIEGNNGSDTVHGGDGADRIIGGSSQESTPGTGRPDTGDWLYGDGGTDLIAGDNAALTIATSSADATRVTLGRGFPALEKVTLLDLGSNPAAGTSGGDYIEGGDSQDVIYGQGGADRIKGNAGDDYAEGGPGVDWVEGDSGNDDLVGGSSTPASGSGDTTAGQPDTGDVLNGGPGDDVALGDNGQILRLLANDQPTAATVRLGSTPGTAMTPRIVQPYDLSNGGSILNAPSADRYGSDRISGGAGVDLLYGQDGTDYISGGPDSDYIEGNGGADVIRGDKSLDDPSGHTPVPAVVDPGWPGAASSADELTGTGTDGQDDLIGGTSRRGFRDTGDSIEGDSGDDVELGDNGTLLRTLQGSPGSLTEKVYTDRYPNGAVPADATRSRVHDPAAGDVSTRFCSTAQTTCEVAGAFGDDQMWGDDGNDGMWGQDGNDTMSGGNGNDDMFGELGDDTMFGDAGQDAMVGDRGGVVNQYLDTGDSPAPLTKTLSGVPQETFTKFVRGSYDRRVDLLHDTDGDQWIGSSTSAPMPHDGLTQGGNDRIRGGADADNIHAGFGNDLANGDSGGDVVFGDDGEDVLWGGKGCDPVLNATTPDCLTNGVFDPTSRGNGDRFVDHVFGGVGVAAGQPTQFANSDILDWRPRGSYAPGTGCATGTAPVTTGSTTVDPCSWFQMTNMDDADPTNNQHHQGTDWLYGGWDRDVLQGDVAQNGPNPGDRLFDWNGAYNLYTHCNAAYGGFNDVRQHSPAMQDFLQSLAWADGAGQSASDVTTSGTSAFRELAMVFPGADNAHGSGSAYPGTPGHFDAPNACGD